MTVQKISPGQEFFFNSNSEKDIYESELGYCLLIKVTQSNLGYLLISIGNYRENLKQVQIKGSGNCMLMPLFENVCWMEKLVLKYF